MNKAERNKITQKKWLKRLKQLNLTQTESQLYTCYKHQAKPCSCYMCKPIKYSRKIKHKLKDEINDEQFKEMIQDVHK